MEFYETPQGRLGLRKIPAVLVDFLRKIPHCRDPENAEAEARIFPPPSSDLEEEMLREDWKAQIEPELDEYFRSAREIVEADLRGLKEGDEVCALEFPARHAEAWLNALNQARLALAEQHGLGEKELAHREAMQVRNEKDLAVFQINFYAALQQWLVEILDV